MAGPTVVSSSSASNTSASNFTISAPASIAAGNLLVLFMSVTAIGTPGYTPPAGWTLLTTSSTGNNPQIDVYTKPATASEPGSYTWTGSGTIGQFTAGIMVQIKGGAIDVYATAAQPSTSTPTAPSVTTTTANDLVLAVITSQANLLSGPGGTTTIATVATSGSAGGEGAYSEAFATPGATGSFSGSTFSTVGAAGVTLALKPAASPICMIL